MKNRNMPVSKLVSKLVLDFYNTPAEKPVKVELQKDKTPDRKLILSANKKKIKIFALHSS